MPDSFGKRNRDRVKADKATQRDERRVARNLRAKRRAAGEPEPEPRVQQEDMPVEQQDDPAAPVGSPTAP